LFMGLDEDWNLQKNEKNCLLAILGAVASIKELGKSTQTNNARSSHTSCRVHWGWRNVPIFIVNCNKFVISVQQTFRLNINPLNAKLNPICHLLALLGAHHIFHVSSVRFNTKHWIFRLALTAFCLMIILL
jgi:hypothetical protein